MVSETSRGLMTRMVKRIAVGGRPSKGERDMLVSRMAKPLADEVRSRAEELDLTYSDYVASVLAEAHGMPQYAPKRHDRTQEELPLVKAS
jgi:hypothetical protein